MDPELKKEVLEIIDRVREAVESDNMEAVQSIMIDGYALIIRVLAQGTDKLPMVILK